MKVLIIEDEPPAAQRLSRLINTYSKSIEILDVIDSVSTAIDYLKLDNQLDLIFLDIQLSDGLSFEIFEHCEIKTPIIFTTAFDEYTLKAFKLNSVDYLLKPVEPSELNKALSKFQDIHFSKPVIAFDDLRNTVRQVLKKSFKERFLIKTANGIKAIATSDIAYFYSEDNYTHIRTDDNHTHIIDYKLDELIQLLDPDTFFRNNRQLICKLSSIKKIENYFNGRFVIDLVPPRDKQSIVSRERVPAFKSWLDR